MRKTLVFVFCLFFGIVAQAFSDKPISNVIVFGDSLSDNGNLYVLDQGVRPLAPYYFGRYSNGLLWVEILTESLGLSPSHLQDNAIAGAKTYGLKPPGLRTQIDVYLDKNPNVDPHALYIIWSGGDDLLDNPNGNKTVADKAIEDIQYAINQLAAHGAETILIPNLPDIGTIPYARMLNKVHPKQKTAANLTKLSKEYNQHLAILLPEMQDKLSIKLVTVDVFDLLHNIMNNPSEYGLSNATDACYTGGDFTGGKGKVCDNPDNYLFWDTIHPSLAGHKQLTVYAIDALQTAGVIQ